MRKDWEVYSIKDLGKIVTGSTPSTKNELNYSSNDYSFVKPSDISQSQISYIDETECYVSEYAFQNSRILPPGAVLVTCIGIIGKVGIIVNDCICNQQINAIIPNKKVNNKFLAYSIFSKKEMLSLIANAPVVPIINKNDFSNIKLSIPPLQTQHQIVEELDCLTSIIEKQKKQLEELDNLAQAIFYDMFGDPIENEKGWKVKKLGDLCISDLGKTLNKSKDTGNSLPYLCSINIQWNYIDLSIKKEALFEENDIKKYSVRKGDLLVCEGGDIGRAAIWKEDYSMLYQNALHRIRFDKNIIAIYVLYFLWRLKQKGILDTRYAKGVTIKHLVKSSLLSINILVPPLSLQQQFASKIEAIEKQKELIKKSIKETEDLFNSRMDYYFN